MFVSVVAIALVTQELDLNHETADTTASQRRRPASTVVRVVPSSKAEVLGEIASHTHRHTAKIQAPVQINLRTQGLAPVKVGDVFVVRAEIVSEEPISALRFQWKLTGKTEHINGLIQGAVESLVPHEPQFVEITLRSGSPENEKIYFVISADQNQYGFGDIVEYNTRPQSPKSNLAEQDSATQLKIQAVVEEHPAEETIREKKVFQ